MKLIAHKGTPSSFPTAMRVIILDGDFFKEGYLDNETAQIVIHGHYAIHRLSNNLDNGFHLTGTGLEIFTPEGNFKSREFEEITQRALKVASIRERIKTKLIK